MKLLKVGISAAVLIPVGIIVAIAGFLIDVPDARTPVQVLGIFAVGVGLLQGQSLLNDCQKMLDEA